MPGEHCTGPSSVFTVKPLPLVWYEEQPKPSMQNVCVSQSTEKALEPKSKAQPVFELAARVSVSMFPFTLQLSFAFEQIGQA